MTNCSSRNDFWPKCIKPFGDRDPSGPAGGSLRRSPRPTAGLKRAALWQGSTGKGWHGKDNGGEKRDHLLPSILESAVAYMSRSFCLGYGPEAKRVTIGAPLERNQPLCSPGAFNGLRRMSSDMCTDTAS